jgi:hypothetical protein
LKNNFPGFSAFREATKFYFLIIVGYSVLIGSLISWIWTHWSKNKWQIYGRYFLTGIIVLLFLWNTKPLITGEIGTLFVPRTIPLDYIVAKDFVLAQSHFSRVLWVPSYSRWGIYTIDHPVLTAIDMVQSDWGDYINLFDPDSHFANDKEIVAILKQSFSHQLLSISSIQYVIIPIRDIENDDDFFVYYGDRDFFIKEIDRIPYLKKIDIGTEELLIYENANYRPHIYLTKEEETIYREISFEKVDFILKSPTEYQVKLEDVSDPIYVNFSEKYHPDWKLRVGEFNWFQVLRQEGYFVSDTNHFENDAKLNSFRVDPSEVCEANICVKNPDGSYDINLTLYFKPQSYFYLGLIISGTTLVLCLGYLGFVGIKGYREKKRKVE